MKKRKPTLREPRRRIEWNTGQRLHADKRKKLGRKAKHKDSYSDMAIITNHHI